MRKTRGLINLLLAALLLWASPVSAATVPFDSEEIPPISSDQPFGESEEENEEEEREFRELAVPVCTGQPILLEPSESFIHDGINELHALDSVQHGPDCPRAPPLSC